MGPVGSVTPPLEAVIVLNVLLLEDDDEDALLVERALRHAGFAYSLKRARNRSEFVAQLDPAPDLVLSDYHLPDFDALGALDHLKERGLDVPLVLVSGLARDEEVLEAVRRGAADFLSKDRLMRLAPAITATLEHRALRQQAREIQQALERGREAAEDRFAATFDQAAVGIAHTTTDGRFLEVNSKLCDILGYAAPELLQRTTRDLTHPDDRDRQDSLRLELLAGVRHAFSGEKRFVRPDGKVIWVNRTVSLSHQAGGQPYLIQVFEDITERKRTERRLARASRAHRILAEGNHAQLHASSEADLLQEVCRITVESGGYVQAYIGFAQDDEQKSIRTVAAAGFEEGYLERLQRSWAGGGRHQGVMGQVIASGEACLMRDVLTDPDMQHRAERARRQGYQSMISLPLKIDGRCIGGFNIYAREPDAFDDEEIALLRGLADDIAFGIVSLRERVARQAAEAAQRESEQRFRETFEQAAVGLTRVDLNGVLVDFNQKFCDMLGYGRDELLGKHIRDVTHPDDYGQGKYRTQVAQGAVRSASGEKRYVRKNGTIIWARRTISLARDAAGRPQYVIGVIEDITERKEAAERYRLTFDNAPIGIMHTDLDRGRILHANSKLCEMFGYAHDELLGMTTAQITHADYVGADLPKYWKSMLEGDMSTFSSERLYRRKDGSTFWGRRTVSLARNAAGSPLYFIRLIEDITERKRAEEAVARERTLLRTIIDTLPDRIYVKDREGRFLLENAANLKVHGIQNHDEIVGKTAFDLFPREVAQRLHAEDQAVMETGNPVLNRERSTPGPSGAVRWHVTTKVPLRDGAGNVLGVVGVNRDLTDRKRAEQALQESEERYRRLFELAPLPLLVMDDETLMIRAVNRAAVEKYGYSQEEFKTMSILDLQVGEDRAAVERELRERDPRAPSERVRRHLTRDGKPIIAEVRARPFEFEGRTARMILVSDITDRRRTEAALRESEEQFRQLANNIPQAFWIADVGQRQTLYVSPAAESMIGRSLQEIHASRRVLVNAVHRDDRRRVYEARKATAAGGYDVTYRVVRPDGTIRWVHDRAFPVCDEAGRVYRIAGIAEDVTERRLAEERLLQLAHYDALTSLPNRVLFYDRLRQALAQARRNQWTVGVMFIDVDRFKNVNDTLGHAVGDRLLQQLSERLTGSVRTGDTVGRLGGDEFAIVLSSLSSPQDANLVAQKLMASFNEPFKIEDSEIYLTASIGITLYPDDSTEQDTLIRNADVAMYRAKELGRNNCQFYTAEMNARAVEALSMENGLRRALERGEFLLHFQPKASIADGTMVGVEALLRWQHPERGLVSPGEFMTVLEDTGLIIPVGAWVLGAVCAQIKAWQEAGIEPVPVAVNLSARQFSARELGPTIQRVMEEHQVDPALIELEITESSIMANTEEAVRTLEYLEKLGVRLAIDDFGTGYSSLGYLKRFPLDALKIDHSFIRDLTTDGDDATITRTVISMAHNLGLKVIAEGVETEAQLAFLAEHGCDEIQGYHFSRPLAAEECGVWLKERRRMSRAAAFLEGGAPTVLLVDDDDDALTLLKRLLDKDDYCLLTARNAHEALELLGQHRVDVVISDQNMPGASGVDFLQRVKALSPKTVRMMTSGFTDFQSVADAVNKGEIFRFLPKGISEERLRAEVRNALRVRAEAAAATGQHAVAGTVGR